MSYPGPKRAVFSHALEEGGVDAKKPKDQTLKHIFDWHISIFKDLTMPPEKRTAEVEKEVDVALRYFDLLISADPSIQREELAKLLGASVRSASVYVTKPEGKREQVGIAHFDNAPRGKPSDQDKTAINAGALSETLEALGNEIRSKLVSPSIIELNIEIDGTISLESARPVLTLIGEDLSTLVAEAGKVDDVSLPYEYPAPPWEEAYSCQEVADLMGSDISTVTRQIVSNKMFGMQISDGVWSIPKDQFLDGKLIEDVADVLSIFENDHSLAWPELIGRADHEPPPPRRIDRLKAAKNADERRKVMIELSSIKTALDYGAHF